MSYFRAMRKEELVAWLLKNGLDGEEGFVDELAEKMVDQFDIMFYSREPT